MICKRVPSLWATRQQDPALVASRINGFRPFVCIPFAKVDRVVRDYEWLATVVSTRSAENTALLSGCLGGRVMDTERSRALGAVEHLDLRVLAYSDMPIPDALEDGWGKWLHATDEGLNLDRDSLVDELIQGLRGQPFSLEDRRAIFSWGADGPLALEVVLH